MILYYAPSWWLRIAAACTPFSWEDVMGLTREKLGKKKKIRLPASLVVPAEQRSRRAAAPVYRPQFEDPDPEPVPDAGTEDSAGQISLFDDPPGTTEEN